MPKWPLACVSFFVKPLKPLTNEYDKVYHFDNSLVKKDLGLTFRGKK